MNNKILLFFCIAISLTAGNTLTAQKRQISEYEASIVAINRLRRDFPTKGKEIICVNKKVDKEGNTLLYEIICKDNQTVLLSGHRACLPILAVFDSRRGSVVDSFERLPCGMQCLIEDYLEQVSIAFQNETLELYHRSTWDSLFNDTMPSLQNTRYQVGPLTTSKWGQSMSNDWQDPFSYNYHIEGNGDCQHCLVGCVAVAMGQIMYYHKFPVLRYRKDKQIDWCNMPDQLLRSDENYFTQREAVSSFLYECAESVSMIYGCEGSSSHDLFARNSLVNHFSYSTSALWTDRFFYNDNDWINMLKEDLDLKRPVLYSGDRYDQDGRHGHVFVCDGYNDRNEFHFNFGLPHSYNTSEYFTIVNLVPNQGMHYIHNHSAVFRIYPNYQHDYCDYNLCLENYYDVFYETHHSNDYPPHTIVPTTMARLTSASSASRYIYRTIPAGVTAAYRAHKEILLRDGFTVEAGAEFTAEIAPCPNCETRNVDAALGEDFGQAVADDVGNEADIYFDAVAPTTAAPLSVLYPNPASGEVTVSVDGEVQSIAIYNAQGQPVGGWKIIPLAEASATLDVSALPAGPYLVRIATPRGTVTKKLVVRRR